MNPLGGDSDGLGAAAARDGGSRGGAAGGVGGGPAAGAGGVGDVGGGGGGATAGGGSERLRLGDRNLHALKNTRELAGTGAKAIRRRRLDLAAILAPSLVPRAESRRGGVTAGGVTAGAGATAASPVEGAGLRTPKVSQVIQALPAAALALALAAAAATTRPAFAPTLFPAGTEWRRTFW